MKVSEIIKYCRVLAGDPDGEYHDDDKMQLHANTVLDEIATRARTICSWQFFRMTAEQGHYGLRDDFLEFKYVGYQHLGQYRPLAPANVEEVSPEIFDTRTQSNKIPYRYTYAGNAHIEKVVATVIDPPTSKEDRTGETFFYSSLPVPNALPGDTIINITDDSEGTIFGTQDSHQQIILQNLRGGHDNKMQVGDRFRLLSPSEHLHTIGVAPTPGKDDAVGQESLAVYMARNHRAITDKHIKDGNDDIELDAEYHAAIRYLMLHYMYLDEHGIEDPNTNRAKISYETSYHSCQPRVEQRVRQFISTWRQGAQQKRSTPVFNIHGDWSIR